MCARARRVWVWIWSLRDWLVRFMAAEACESPHPSAAGAGLARGGTGVTTVGMGTLSGRIAHAPRSSPMKNVSSSRRAHASPSFRIGRARTAGLAALLLAAACVEGPLESDELA